MLCQRTIKAITNASGVGLHSGQLVEMSLRPAEPGTGIVFRRVDLPQPVEVPASALLVGDSRLCSCLVKDDPEAGLVQVSTVEHLMSALAGLGVDNVWVDLNGSEVPIFDGSASPFVFLLQSAELEEQPIAKKFIRLKDVIEVKDGDKWARLEPYDGFRMDLSINFGHPAICDSSNSVRFDFTDQSYLREIARARTFGFVQEVEWMRDNGLALGGSLDNAIVLDEFRVLNDEGLRYRDEFARHKLLDALGDIYLLGHPLLASFTAHKSGHALVNKLARALLLQQEKWEITTFTQPEQYPAGVINWLGMLQAS